MRAASPTRTDEQRRRHREEAARSRAKRRAEDPEGTRIRHHEANVRWEAKARAEDPEGFAAHWRELQAERKTRLKAKDPDKFADNHNRHNRALRYRKNGLSRARVNEIISTVKASCPLDIVGDVASAVIVDVLEGRALASKVAPAIKEQVRAHRRQYDQYKTVSLDVRHPETGQAWIDNLDSETPHF